MFNKIANSLLLSLALVSSAIGQATITLPSVASGESSLSTTLSATAMTNLASLIASAAPMNGWPNTAGVPYNTTLSTALTDTSTTSVVLASVTNLAACNGLRIDSEIMSVVTAGSTSTVVRGTAGTTPATHLATAPVTVLRTGNFACALKSLLADSIAGLINAKLLGSAVTTQTAAAAAAQSNIAATAWAAVQ